MCSCVWLPPRHGPIPRQYTRTCHLLVAGTLSVSLTSVTSTSLLRSSANCSGTQRNIRLTGAVVPLRSTRSMRAPRRPPRNREALATRETRQEVWRVRRCAMDTLYELRAGG